MNEHVKIRRFEDDKKSCMSEGSRNARMGRLSRDQGAGYLFNNIYPNQKPLVDISVLSSEVSVLRKLAEQLEISYSTRFYNNPL